MVISCATEQTIENIAHELVQKSTATQHFVIIVTDKKQYIAVNNIEVLDAAIKAKQPKIQCYI